jgi:hypothetical protein
MMAMAMIPTGEDPVPIEGRIMGMIVSLLSTSMLTLFLSTYASIGASFVPNMAL